MVDVAPGKMIPASHVIEFVPEVPIPIVEVKVQQKICDGQEQNYEHAIR
jgi:hypothetical protein